MVGKYSISREFWFSAAHRIEGHPKCGRLHGHNYKVVVQISKDRLDKQGMVIDFGLVDHVVKPLIEKMDHMYLISQANMDAEDEYASVALRLGDGFKLGIKNSTAEELSMLIWYEVREAFQLPPDAVAVTVQETPRNEATYTV